MHIAGLSHHLEVRLRVVGEERRAADALRKADGGRADERTCRRTAESAAAQSTT